MSEGIHPHLIKKKKKSTGNRYEQESMYFSPLFLSKEKCGLILVQKVLKGTPEKLLYS